MISIGCDHGGFELKNVLLKYLTELGYEYKDCGTFDEASVDYPDIAKLVCADVTSGACEFGIAICGSANGITMTVNKHQGCRAAICWEPELAALARQHNNANVLSLPARFISEEKALEIVKTFFANDFEGGRHERRVEKIAIAAE